MVGRSSITGLPEPDERLGEGLRALKGLAPYLWPRDSLELRVRVVLALVLLVAGKLVNITIPLFYKHAVDALSTPAQSRPRRGAGRADPRLWRARGSCRRASTSCATRSSPRSGSARCAGSRCRRSGISMRCRCAFTWNGAPAVWRARSSAARRGSSSCCPSCCSTSCRPCSRSLVVCAILWRLYDWTFAAVTLATIVVYIAFTFVDHRLAHPLPARDEHAQHRGQYQGGRQPAELRDGQVFRQRGARGASATTARCKPMSAPRSRARRRWRCSMSARARSSPPG